jgi:hypothetical protein
MRNDKEYWVSVRAKWIEIIQSNISEESKDEESKDQQKKAAEQD